MHPRGHREAGRCPEARHQDGWGQGAGGYRDACRRVGLNSIKEQLEEADMVRTYRIMYGHDKLDKQIIRKMEEAREKVGRRRFWEKEIKRTVAVQKESLRKNSFASRPLEQLGRRHQEEQESGGLQEGIQTGQTSSSVSPAQHEAKSE